MLSRVRAPLGLLLIALLASCGEDLTQTEHGLMSVEVNGASGIAIQFDSVAVGDMANVKVFNIRNDSDEADLRINEVALYTASPYIKWQAIEPLPTCLEGVCSFAAFDIGPRANVQFDLVFDPLDIDPQCGVIPPGKADNYCGYVEIRSNDPSNPTHTIDLFLTPIAGTLQVCLGDGGGCGGMLNLDYTAASIGDLAQPKAFTVQNVGANILTIESIDMNLEPAAEFVLSGASAPFTLGPTELVTLTLSFTALSNDAVTRGGTVVVVSDAPSNSSATLAVTVGNPNAAQIDVSPRQLAFVDIKPPSSERKNLTITNLGGATAGPLTVSVSIDPSSNEDYAVYDASERILDGPRCREAPAPQSCDTQLVIPRSSSVVLSVEYTPQTVEGTSATLRLSSNDPDEADRVIEVPLTSSAALAILTATPVSLTWTNPANGTPEAKTVELENAGEADLTVSAVELRNFADATLFTHDLVTPLVLAAGQKQTMTVTFTRPADEPIGVARAGDIVLMNSGVVSETIVSVGVEYP